MMPCAHSNGIWVWQHQHLPRGFPEMNTDKYNHVNENCVSTVEPRLSRLGGTRVNSPDN